MRLLFVSNLYPPNVVGGYERLCFEVAAAMATRAHDVWVLTSDYGGETADYPGQKIDRSLRLLTGSTIYQPFDGSDAERASINAANIDRLNLAFAAAQPDLIYSWNLFFLDRSFLEALSSLSAPAAVMLTDNWLANMFNPEYVAAFFRGHVFGAEPFPPPPPPPSASSGWLARLLRPPRVARSPAPSQSLDVAAVYGSEFMQRFYRHAGLHFQTETVIHNGVHQDDYASPAPRSRSRPAAPGEFRILFAGRLVDLKGADTVVAALDHLEASRPAGVRVRLTIVGDEQDIAYVAQLQALIDAYRGSVLIERRPTVAEAALAELFAEHDVYVFPSLYEPFSLTLIHALAAGIPTIASDAGGNVEIVADGVSGLIYPKGDAVALAGRITRLALEPALRETLSRGGRGAAQRFSFEKMIARTESFCRELARG